MGRSEATHKMMKDKRGRNVLFAAAMYGKLHTLKYLVADGLYYEEDNEGNTPLHIAAKFNHLPVVIYLAVDLEKPCATPNKQGFTPLHYAAYAGSLPIVKFFKNKGLDMNQKTNSGFNCLHLACKKGHLELVQYLIEKAQLNVNEQTFKSKSSALHFAAEGKHYKVVENLL